MDGNSVKNDSYPWRGAWQISTVETLQICLESAYPWKTPMSKHSERVGDLELSRVEGFGLVWSGVERSGAVWSGLKRSRAV